jgi:hypothetical protein
MVQRFRFGLGREARDRRQRDRRSVRGPDVIVEKLILIEPIALFHLWDDLVGAAVEIEIIGVGAPEHRSERAAHVIHLETELRRFLTIDDDGNLRLVDLEIGVEKDEVSGLERPGEEFASYDVELLGRIRGGDDELDRQAVRARQRRGLEGDDLGSRYCAHLVLDHALQCSRARLALFPELEHPDRNPISRRVDLKHLVGFRMALERLVRGVRVELALLQRRVRRRGRQRQHDALVLAGREFGGRILK